jgi:hypothetical protein
MSEIMNYTMNFSSGRPQCERNVRCTLASSEIHRLQCVVASSLGCVGVGSDV